MLDCGVFGIRLFWCFLYVCYFDCGFGCFCWFGFVVLMVLLVVCVVVIAAVSLCCLCVFVVCGVCNLLALFPDGLVLCLVFWFVVW